MSRRVGSPTSSSLGQGREVGLVELGVQLGELLLVADDLGGEPELLQELASATGVALGVDPGPVERVARRRGS